MVLPPPLLRLFLGSNPERHSAIGLTLLVSALYLFNAGLILAARHLGYASPTLTPYMLGCLLVGGVTFYGLLRSGLSQRWSDPNLVMAQGLYCAFAVAMGYLTVHMHFRGVVLTFMPAILLPTQFALSPPRIRQLTCERKLPGEGWLEVAKIAHRQGLRTNATMLYGHIETIDFDVADHWSDGRAGGRAEGPR